MDGGSPQEPSLETVKSSLYCLRCNLLLRDAVEVGCCHALFCAHCVARPADGEPTAVCINCGREMLSEPKPNHPVRRLVSSIPVRCPSEGCTEIVAAGALQDHVKKYCDYTSVPCAFLERGCVVTTLRKDIADHQKNSCVFRDTPCPQGCGAVMQWRDCTDHFEICGRTLVECDVRCGCLVERRHLHEHMNECPQKPVACPYRGLGCSLDKPVRREEVEEHMACSVHAHLQLLDTRFRELERKVQAAAPMLLRPPSHDWDVGYIQCVDKWAAQLNTINAMTFIDGNIVTGCSAGTLLVLHTATGKVIVERRVSDLPVCSLLGLGDGRLVVGLKVHQLQVWSNLVGVLCQTVTLHPIQVAKSKGVLALAKANLEKDIHLRDRPELLHPELYAVPTIAEGMLTGIFEVVFAATEDHVRVLDAATMEVVSIIDGNYGSMTSLLVHHDDYLLSGNSDGSVRVHHLRHKDFPQLYWLQCFGGRDGVSCMAMHPVSFYRGAPVVCLGGADGSIGFWDFTTKLSCDQIIHGGHKGKVTAMVPVDGTYVASGGIDEYWRVWDAVAPHSHADLPGSMYCAVSSQNILYAAGSQGCVRLWTATALRYNKRRQPPPQPEAPL